MATYTGVHFFRGHGVGVNVMATLNVAKLAAMAENKGAHWRPPPSPCHACCSAVSMHNDAIVHTRSGRTSHTCYLLPWPIVYYKCI